MLKFSTTTSSSWGTAVEVEKIRSSGSVGFSKEVIPLNPLVQLRNFTLVLLSRGVEKLFKNNPSKINTFFNNLFDTSVAQTASYDK